VTRRPFAIIDSTLREGEQTPGISFSEDSRKTIIGLVHRVGIDEIELGIASPLHRHLPRLVADARQITKGACRLGLWSRCRPEDISFAAKCGPDVLSLSIPVSDLHIKERLQKDRHWIKQTLAQAIRQGLSLGIPCISVGLEDGSRADPGFLRQVAAVAEKNGARRVRLADTVGTCSPAALIKLVSRLKRSVTLEIGVHCHNDFGMATANSIAAIESGASWLDATVLGLGERAGNCRLEEVVGFMTLIRGDRHYRPNRLADLCSYVAKVTGSPIQGNHPIVGENIFTCETGLHQHGLSIDPGIYEPYEPRLVGSERKLRYGRKTGKRAIRLQLAGQGIQLNESQAGQLAACLRSKAKPLSPEQLQQFAAKIIP
jgi:homocitrate synthase NifV